MTRRLGWLLLNLACGAAALPGCALLRGGDPAAVPASAPKTPADVIAKEKEPTGRASFSYTAGAGEKTDSVFARKLAPIRRLTSGGLFGTSSTSQPGDGPTPLTPEEWNRFWLPDDGVKKVAAAQPTPPPAPETKPAPVVLPTVYEGADPPAAAPAKGETKAPKRSPLVEALQCMLDDRHQDALGHLQAYDAQTQEFFLGILPTLTIFAKKRLPDLSTQEAAVLNDQLQSLLVTLRPRTELVIDKMCYCDEIKAYGVYRPRDDRPFLASTQTRPGDVVQLYVELRNFASERAADGNFETRLASTVELRDGRGETVWRHAFKDDEHPLRSRTRRNDLFNNYTFYVPVLRPGNYQLVVRIADETIPELRREAHKTLDFRVTAVAGQPPR